MCWQQLSYFKFALRRALETTETPLLISRTHAVLEYDEATSQWTIADHKSVNGTYVDGCCLAPHTPHILRDGCVLTIGGHPDLRPGDRLSREMECMYTFREALTAVLGPLACAECRRLPALAHIAPCGQCVRRADMASLSSLF
jgi:hypothetical protein